MVVTTDTLLSYVLTRHFIASREDAATDALAFIINHSKAARDAFSGILRERVDGIALVGKVQTQVLASGGGYPDMVAYDDSDGIVALVEVKFWADPTEHQLATYWNELPLDRPSLLMFLVPEVRVKALWSHLQVEIKKRGHQIEKITRADSVRLARDISSHRRMSIISWESLLSRIKGHVETAEDTQAAFEITQLQGFADKVIANDFPQRDENLKRLIADAIARLEQSGWADTTGLSWGEGSSYYGKYLHLAGNLVWLGIEYRAWKQMPNKPLWLLFFNRDYNTLSVDRVRSYLEDMTSPLEWRTQSVQVPINLDPSDSSQAMLDSVVSQLEGISKRIDPNGPTKSLS